MILEIIPTAIRSHWSRFALFGRHEIDRELKAMPARLDEHGELSSLTAEELCRHGVKQTGREKSVLHRTNGAIRADAREQINHALLTSARQGMLESRLMDGHKAGAPEGLIFRPNRRPMSPSHTRRRGRIYRYYVTREAIADGYDTCAVTSVPAADVEGAVLDHVQKLLAAPKLVARTWAAAKRNDEHEITECEVTILLAEFATVWNELFPAEQARILQLLVERVDVQEDALEVRIRAEGLASLIGELRQQGERMAA